MNFKNAKQTFLDVKRILDQSGIRFWLVDGAALGAVREGSIIANDQDIDLRVWAADWNFPIIFKKLISEGFICKKIRDTKHYGNLSPGSVLYKRGIKLDICLGYYYPPESTIAVLAYEPRSNVSILPARFFKDDYFINFMGINTRVPSPPEEYLEIRYGKNWRIPVDGSYPNNIPISIKKEVEYFHAHPKINIKEK